MPAQRWRSIGHRIRSFAHASAWGVLVGSAAGCGGNAATATAEAEAQGAVTATCAPQIEQTNGHACTGDATCGFPIECGEFRQHAECRCAGGRFICSDAIGELAPDASPRCAPTSPPTRQACPTTMAATSARTCDTIGRLCFFENRVCPARLGVTQLDYCGCKRNVDDGHLAFKCTILPCSTLGDEPPSFSR